MKVVSKKGHAKIKLNDKQMGDILSLLAVGVVKFEKLKDKEVSTTKADLLDLSEYLINEYARKAGYKC